MEMDWDMEVSTFHSRVRKEGLQRLTSFCCWTQTYFRSTIKFRSTRLQTKKLVATELPLNHSSFYPYNNKQGFFSWRTTEGGLGIFFYYLPSNQSRKPKAKTPKRLKDARVLVLSSKACVLIVSTGRKRRAFYKKEWKSGFMVPSLLFAEPSFL